MRTNGFSFNSAEPCRPITASRLTSHLGACSLEDRLPVSSVAEVFATESNFLTFLSGKE